MSGNRKAVLLFCAAIVLLLPLQASDNADSSKMGQLVGKNVYTNPALSMTISLPGEWQFFDKDAQQRLGVGKQEPPQDPACRGPFCRMEIDVALISLQQGQAPRGAIFLIAFKLPSEYLDRRRYPLKKFAEAMTTNSLGGTDWIISGELTPMELDKRPAYRLLVHKPVPGGQGKGFGYVAESNGYAFLLVGTVPDIVTDYPRQLQDALEAMKLKADVKK
jgi:hypothetical protein